MKTENPKHIMVGLSGGVDSSVSAYLLKKAGHHVEGIFMKNWEGDDTDNFCPAAQDIADAEAVCDILGIKLEVVNFSNQYWEKVFSYFLEEYQQYRTPNPDILCNKEIKFKTFLDYAKNRGADFIATGHYVRKLENEKGTFLLKGSDAGKDQSYFLHALTESQVAQSIFPIGDLSKSEVRKIAQGIGLKNFAKKDSTGICFIGERKFKTFLNEYLPAKSGNIESIDGEIIGRHDGLMFYTIGQRQGLQIGGRKDANDEPWYVAKKDISRNCLVVVQGSNHSALYQSALKVASIHWVSYIPAFPFKTKAKTRYRQVDQACVINQTEKGFEILFDEPQRAITPGQSIVFYEDDICLGGGIIES